MSEETYTERRARIDRELERSLNRAMVPFMLPMVITAGALLGLLITILFNPLPLPFVGIFMLIAIVVGCAPLAYTIFKYR